LRVISGSAKGKRLAAFPGGTIRPTPDRVREALFSILHSRLGPLKGKTVLDLFAGTGAMALEALSRGCRRAILVDQSQQAERIISANLKTCGFEEQAAHIRGDVLQVLPRLKGDGPFDLIFLDPPYGRDMVSKIMKSLFDLELLAPEGIVCAESARDDAVPETIGELVRFDQRHYGSTSIHLFTRPEPEAETR
jgi:16S rRNA (guanine(966)-N(2))-methyltransferase RsmD